MKRLGLALLGALVLAAQPAAAAPKCEADRPIIFAGMDWASNSFPNAVAGFIMEKGFGRKVDRIPGSTIAMLTGLEIQGLAPAARTAKGREWTRTVSLEGYESAFPNEPWGGMQRRAGVARALATDPDILLKDEPFSALGPLIRRKMQDPLLELQAGFGKTILFVTHELAEAAILGGRIAVLRDGALERIGKSEDISRAPATEHVAAFVASVRAIPS